MSMSMNADPASGRAKDPKADAGFHWGSDVVDITGRDLPGLKASYLVQHAPISGRLVEIGSGGGKMLRTLRQHLPNLELHGCDIREAPATDVYAFRTLSMDTPRLPYDSASFDAVAIMDVLEHVPSPAETLDEVVRILKPGGKLVGFVPIEGERFSMYSLYRALLGNDVYAKTKEHIQAFSHESLDALITERFRVLDKQFSYHALGHVMDASLYAATKVPGLGKFFWKENDYYKASATNENENETAKAPSLASKLMNASLRFANLLAWTESTALHKVQWSSAGVLLTAEKSR
jgi:ubiquinone/menaquinone biosynthesis C-methylase UbiE